MSGNLDSAPIPLVNYSCLKCEVGWSSALGDKCWLCEEQSHLMEPINIWWMKQHTAPAWRRLVDTHTTGTETETT